MRTSLVQLLCWRCLQVTFRDMGSLILALSGHASDLLLWIRISWHLLDVCWSQSTLPILCVGRYTTFWLLLLRLLHMFVGCILVCLLFLPLHSVIWRCLRWWREISQRVKGELACIFIIREVLFLQISVLCRCRYSFIFWLEFSLIAIIRVTIWEASLLLTRFRSSLWFLNLWSDLVLILHLQLLVLFPMLTRCFLHETSLFPLLLLVHLDFVDSDVANLERSASACVTIWNTSTVVASRIG